MKKYIFTLLFIHTAPSLAMCNLEALPLISKTSSDEKPQYFSIIQLEQLKTDARDDAQNNVTKKIEQTLKWFPVNQFLDENKTTLLSVAVTQEYLPMVQLLLETYKANPNTRNLVRWSPLMIAARRGNTGIAELLVTYGANKDARNQHGEKPYQIAERNGYGKLAKELKPQGEWFFKALKVICP